MDLQDINEEIASISITIGDISSHRRHSALLKRHPTLPQPIACLQIPNDLFILWTRKLAFQSEQHNSVFKHSALVNQSILVGDIKISETLTLEKRLQKERSRIMSLYKQRRKGSRAKLQNATTHVLLFENEVTRFSSMATRATVGSCSLSATGQRHPETATTSGIGGDSIVLQMRGKKTQS